MKAKKGISVTLTREEARLIILTSNSSWRVTGNWSKNRYSTWCRALNKLEKALEAKAP